MGILVGRDKKKQERIDHASVLRTIRERDRAERERKDAQKKAAEEEAARKAAEKAAKKAEKEAKKASKQGVGATVEEPAADAPGTVTETVEDPENAEGDEND